VLHLGSGVVPYVDVVTVVVVVDCPPLPVELPLLDLELVEVLEDLEVDDEDLLDEPLDPEDNAQGGPTASQDLPDVWIELEQQFDAPPGLLEQLVPPHDPQPASQHAIPSE